MEKRFEIDTKGGWFKNRYRFFNAVYDGTISEEEWKQFKDLKDTVIYESPKTYVDGVAHNDGTWVIFNACRTKNGKVRTNIRCKDLNDLIRNIYGYMTFLRLAGITNKKMMLYHTIVFFDRLTFIKGLFDCNKKNVEILGKLIDIVFKKDITELTKDWTRGITGKQKVGCWDERAFCMDTKGMSKSDIVKKQHKEMNKKQKLDEQIAKFWQPGKSIREMLEFLHANDIKVSKRRYCLWLKEKKAVQNGLYVPKTILHNQEDDNEDRLCKMDFSAPKVDNEDVDGPCKMVHNFSYIKDIVLSDDKPMDEEKEKNQKRKNNGFYQSDNYLLNFYSREELDMIREEQQRLDERNRAITEIPTIREYDIFI